MVSVKGYFDNAEDNKLFTNSYEWFGQNYDEELKVAYGIEYPNKLSYSQDFQAYIDVLYAKTTSPDDPLYEEDMSLMSIGHGGPTKIELILQGKSDETMGGDAFHNAEANYIGVKSASIQIGADVELGYTYSPPYVPITFSLEYYAEENMDLNDYYDSWINNIDRDQLTRTADFEINKEYMIEDSNHQYTIDFSVHKYDTVVHNNNKISAQFTMSVWDGFQNVVKQNYTDFVNAYYISD